MDWLHEFIRSACEDGKGSFPSVDLGVLPELPNRRHPEGFSTGQDKLVFRLFSLLHILPLEDRVGRNNTAPFFERFLPKSCLHDFFRTSVEQQLLWNSKRPSHEFNLSFAIFIEENNRLDRIGSDVLPRLEVDLFKTGANRKASAMRCLSERRR